MPVKNVASGVKSFALSIMPSAGSTPSVAPPANTYWLYATVFLFHSRHQERSQADERYPLPGQALLYVSDQKMLVAARNFHSYLPIDRKCSMSFSRCCVAILESPFPNIYVLRYPIVACFLPG